MDEWRPDQDFLEFLRIDMELHGGAGITLKGGDLLAEMKKGTEVGKELYGRLWKDKKIQKRYSKWERKYSGVLDGFFETGSEGVCWVLDTKPGSNTWEPDALVFIKLGDRLKVWGEDGKIVFDGVIVPDFKTGWTHYPLNPDPKMGQQCALDYWIHWVQKGWKPDDWAALFLKHKEWANTHARKADWKNCKKLCAELIRTKKPR